MSNSLMDTLENRVFSAVDKIETLRSEINELKEDRRILEDKLRELIGKMEQLDGQTTTSLTEEPASSDQDNSSGPVNPGPTFGPTF